MLLSLSLTGRSQAVEEFDPANQDAWPVAVESQDDFIRATSGEIAASHSNARLMSSAYEEASNGRRLVVDLMVLYTGLAKAEYGNDGVESRILLAVGYLNEVCERSGVKIRFRLVYQAETTWHAESCQSADELDWLSHDPTVAKLRDLVGADLVSLFVREGDPNGGMAQLPGSFSVFDGSARVFAHECAHNFGCEHDRPNSLNGESSDCNFGYSFVSPGTSVCYGDIMSYVGSPMDQFSNPNIFFNDAPTGLDIGHVNELGQPDAADNAAYLNRSASTVADARPTQVPSVDSETLLQGGTQFSFRIASVNSDRCLVECSPDFSWWQCLTNSVLAFPSAIVLDNVGSAACRFYRVRVGGGRIATYLGYLRKSVPVGLSMMANPLEAQDNRIQATIPAPPEGTQVYKWMEGEQRWSWNSFQFGAWDVPNMTLSPGEGFIIRNPSNAPFDLQFFGEANPAFQSRVPLQLSIRSSALPQTGGISQVLKYNPFGPGGQIYRMTGSDGSYTCYSWDGESWTPHEPTIALGEAFWCRNPVNAFIWRFALPSLDTGY